LFVPAVAATAGYTAGHQRKASNWQMHMPAHTVHHVHSMQPLASYHMNLIHACSVLHLYSTVAKVLATLQSMAIQTAVYILPNSWHMFTLILLASILAAYTQ
jgi:hypothetical protein